MVSAWVVEGSPMWTIENRARYDRSKLRYPSDLTDEEWSHVAPFIPPAKRGGNKRTVNVREVVNGLGRVDGFENDQAECECDERPEVPVGLLAAERDALETLELSHELLDAGARPVERLREEAGRFLAEDFTGITGQMPRLRAAARLALAS